MEPTATLQTDKPKSSTTTTEEYEDRVVSELLGCDRNFDAVKTLIIEKEQTPLTAAEENGNSAKLNEDLADDITFNYLKAVKMHFIECRN